MNQSGHAIKESFLQAVKDGEAVFPTILTLKLARSIRTVPEADTGETQTFVNTNVLDAQAQDMIMPRTITILQLVPILRSLTTMTDAILPAALHMLKPTALYPLQVQYPVADLEAQPCQKVWVFMKATKKSKCTEVFPYTVVTEDIDDALESDAEMQLGVPPPKYKLISLCSKEARTSYLLTPTHGKHVFALAVITSVQDNTLFAESVETIQKDEKNSSLMTMLQEMTLAVELMKHASAGVTTPWTDVISPLAAPRCRVLGKSPRGPQLDSMDNTPAQIPRLQ